MRGRLPH